MMYSTYYKLKQTDKSNFQTDRKFIHWVDTVEYIVMGKLKMGLLDLPDENYIVNFENGMVAGEMAKKIIDGYFYYFF